MLFCAAFLPEDPDCLMRAALACPVCLHADVHFELCLEPHDPRADCVCGHCGAAHTVYLTPDQALRLSLSEPAATPRAARA